MGNLRHIYGDDMTPEEKERLDHAELIQQSAPNQFGGYTPSDIALLKFHDRFYGPGTECKWCREWRVVRFMPALEQIFKKPADKPTTQKISIERFDKYGRVPDNFVSLFDAIYAPPALAADPQPDNSNSPQ